VRSSKTCTPPFGKGLKHDDDTTTVLGAMRVQEPSGAAGAGMPRGFAETFGLLSNLIEMAVSAGSREPFWANVLVRYARPLPSASGTAEGSEVDPTSSAGGAAAGL
jgi:hypothetical protein